MDFVAGPPSKWSVTLLDGSTVDLWADGFGEEDGHFVFSILVDATAEEQKELEVTGRTPTRPERVVITVARLPVRVVHGQPMSSLT